MKPRQIALRGAHGRRETIDTIVHCRLDEVLALASALQPREQRALHDFRIACKRLRYALERFEKFDPELETAAERLAQVQDALGEAHDRDVLLAILPPTMPQTERRLLQERGTFVDRAAALWSGLPASLRPRYGDGAGEPKPTVPQPAS